MPNPPTTHPNDFGSTTAPARRDSAESSLRKINALLAAGAGTTPGTPSATPITVQGSPTGTPIVAAGTGYSVAVSKTRPADTAAYALGDVLNESASAGTVWTFAAIGPTAGRILITAIVLEIDVAAVPAGMGAFRLHLYDAAPTAINDNAAFDLAAGDRTKYLGFIDIPLPEKLGSTLWAQDDTIRKQVKLAAASTSIYGMLETRSAFPPTASALLKLGLRALRLE